MVLSQNIADAAASAAADAVTALLVDGYLRIYDGTEPADADTAPTAGEHLLAELRFGNPAYEGAVAGVAAALAITPDSDANATGTATWFRALQSNGTTAVFDGSVGTLDCNLNLNSAAIQIHAAVSVTALPYTQSQV